MRNRRLGGREWKLRNPYGATTPQSLSFNMTIGVFFIDERLYEPVMTRISGYSILLIPGIRKRFKWRRVSPRRIGSR